MKQAISKEEFNELPVLNRLFLALWMERKGYGARKEITYGELLELGFALSNDFKYETSPERAFFNNLLEYETFHTGFDGSEPIEALSYEVNKKLRQRIVRYGAAQI